MNHMMFITPSVIAIVSNRFGRWTINLLDFVRTGSNPEYGDNHIEQGCHCGCELFLQFTPVNFMFHQDEKNVLFPFSTELYVYFQ